VRNLKAVFRITAIVLAQMAFGEKNWETLETQGEPVARHEAAFVEFNGEFLLLGGRGIRPVSIYNPEKNSWRNASKPPVEFHHFQPLTYQDKILIICAMTGPFPGETPLNRILIYSPAADEWSWGDEIPAARRRGSAGVVLADGMVYVVGGIVNGHMGGYVSWFDQYNPATLLKK